MSRKREVTTTTPEISQAIGNLWELLEDRYGENFVLRVATDVGGGNVKIIAASNYHDGVIKPKGEASKRKKSRTRKKVRKAVKAVDREVDGDDDLDYE